MIINRFTSRKFVICLLLALMVTSCTSPPVHMNENGELLKSPTINSTQNTLGESATAPIVLMSLKDHSIEFTCLNRLTCYPTIDHLNFQNIDLFNSIMDKTGNLYLPLSWPEGSVNEHSNASLLYIEVQDGTQSWISLPDKDSSLIYLPFLHPLESQNGEITFEDSNDTLFVLNQGLLLRTFALPDAQEVINSAPILQTDESIPFNLILPGLTFHKEGKALGLIHLVDTLTGTVNSRLVPLPQFMEGPIPQELKDGQKYGLKIETISDDLKTVYISYSTVSEPGGNSLIDQIAKYDWTTQSETTGPDISSFEKYRGMLFQRSFNDLNSIPTETIPVMLFSLKDWRWVDEFKNIQSGLFQGEGIRIQIHPFGDYFLVGTTEKVFEISLDTYKIQEYSLPPKITNQSYYLVQYWK